MSELITGGCLCGAYTFEFPRESVVSAFHCHCKDCQTFSGGGKTTLAMVPTAALQTRGELKTYTVIGSDGAHVTRGFCPHCGSQPVSYVEELPAMRLIKAGTLTDSSWLTVAMSCWGSSAAAWLPVDENTIVFDKNPVF